MKNKILSIILISTIFIVIILMFFIGIIVNRVSSEIEIVNNYIIDRYNDINKENVEFRLQLLKKYYLESLDPQYSDNDVISYIKSNDVNTTVLYSNLDVTNKWSTKRTISAEIAVAYFFPVSYNTYIAIYKYDFSIVKRKSGEYVIKFMENAETEYIQTYGESFHVTENTIIISSFDS